MKSPYVLEHSPEGIKDARAKRQALEVRSRWLPIAPRSTSFALDYINPSYVLSSVLAALITSFPSVVAGVAHALPASIIDIAKKKVDEANYFPNRKTRIWVGVWNLDAFIGNLSNLIRMMNHVQRTFIFREVRAVVPSGLISRPERMVSWLTELSGKDLDQTTRGHITDNLLANDFFGLADMIRIDLSLDYIVGLTPSMVAGEATGEGGRKRPYWNHFSTFEKRTILASIFQLDEFARSTKRPIDAFLMVLIASQLLVALSWPKLGFHEDRECIFDYDRNRTRLANKVINPKIEPECLDKIDAPYREAALAFVNLIKTLKE